MEGTTEASSGESRHFVGTMLCWYTCRGDRFDSGMVKMQLTSLGNVELYRQESVGRRAC